MYYKLYHLLFYSLPYLLILDNLLYARLTSDHLDIIAIIVDVLICFCFKYVLSIFFLLSCISSFIFILLPSL